jgi:lipoprotein-releasing system ATP-binding protein
MIAGRDRSFRLSLPSPCKIECNRMMQTSPAAASQAPRTAQDSQLRLENQAHGAQPQPTLPLIQLQNLEKTYQTARGKLTLFRDLNLEIEAGEMVAIVGQSGAGKSTLLHILGALDTPTAGTVYCASTNVAALSQREAAAFRTICCRSLRRWKTSPCR